MKIFKWFFFCCRIVR